jgi:hypothetical protein
LEKSKQKKIVKAQRKGFNSMVILGSWTLWLHRNRRVFDGATPSLATAQHSFKEELSLWCFAGAQKLQELVCGCGEVLV